MSEIGKWHGAAKLKGTLYDVQEGGESSIQKKLLDSVYSLAFSVERLTISQKNTAEQLSQPRSDVDDIKKQAGKTLGTGDHDGDRLSDNAHYDVLKRGEAKMEHKNTLPEENEQVKELFDCLNGMEQPLG